jgi:hypothetical protein
MIKECSTVPERLLSRGNGKKKIGRKPPPLPFPSPRIQLEITKN